MNKDYGLVLEGGAMRSVFSTGVLDCLLDENIIFPNIMTLSAGAYAATGYASGEKNWVYNAIINPLKEYKYLGPSVFFKKGTFFDMDYLFEVIPKTVAPLDFEAFCQSAIRFIVSTVNCVTAETVYHEKFDSLEQLLQTCKASNSLPFIARVCWLNGQPMLDGGMDQAIPIAKAVEEGWKKILVVLTRDSSYRKAKQHPLYLAAVKAFYHKYPEFYKLVKSRPERYNESLEQVLRLEKEGRVMIIRPEGLALKNSESDPEVLGAYHQHGYDVAKKRIDEIKAFLQV